jgi:ABC-type polysaccharide/polyol phosphate export permease
MSAAPIEYQRPNVLGSDLRRFWSLTWTLAVTDWKLRFYGSVLGYVWTLARPFLFFGVIYFVFTEIVGTRSARSSCAKGCCARCASRGW